MRERQGDKMLLIPPSRGISHHRKLQKFRDDAGGILINGVFSEDAETDKPSVSVKLQMEKLVLVSQRPLGPLMLAVHQLCVIGQALIVKDVLVQRVSVVPCVKRTEERLLPAQTRRTPAFPNASARK